jgi:hypothetical protein
MPLLRIFTSKSSPVPDVTIVTNFCPSYASLPAGAAASNAKRHKDEKHKGNVEGAGPYRFFPVVIESSGHCDPFIDEFANRSPLASRSAHKSSLHQSLPTPSLLLCNGETLASSSQLLPVSTIRNCLIIHYFGRTLNP